jgi:outer membrane protein assembly factor BamB
MSTATNGRNLGSTIRRFGLPLGIIALAGIASAIFMLIPDLAHDARNFYTFLAVVGAVFLLTIWLVAVSGARWYVRVSVVALEALALAIIAPNLVFDGDMIPHIRNPLEKHDDEVEKHRREHLASGPSKPIDLSVSTTDWPEFRGRKRDGVVVGPKLARDWKAKPPREIWKQPCGAGWGSFAIAGSLLVTLEQRRDNEAIVAYDAESGKELWKYEYPARFWEALGGLGPRTTPTIADGDVYSLGAEGHLVCVDAKTGVHKWTADILDGAPNLKWGMAGSPLIVGENVVLNPGFQGESKFENRALSAYNRKSGKLAWSWAGRKAGYSSPMLATFDGIQQIVLLDGNQVAGYDISSGVMLWTYPWEDTNQDINVAQPIIWEAEGRVFISSGYSIGCAMLHVLKSPDGWKCDELKKTKYMRCKMSSPIEYQGYIYGLDEGILTCIDSKECARKWREDRFGHGQLLRCEDLLILLAENGDLVLLEATPAEQRILGRVPAIKAQRTWNTPAMANGRIYVRNDREMACFDLRD